MFKVLTFISLMCFFLGGTALRIESFSSYINPLLFISTFVIIIISLLFSKGSIEFYINKLTIIYIFFILGIIFSELLAESYSHLLFSIKVMLPYLVFMVCLPSLRSFFTFRMVAISFITSSTLIILLSFVEKTPTLNMSATYSGLFDNPNSMGLLAATFFSFMLTLFVSNLFYKVNFRRAFFYFILMIMALLLIALSSSRTSFVATIIIVTIIIGFYVLDSLIINRIYL